MAWQAITEADIKTRMSGPELTAFRSAALASGQSDPVADVIESVTELVRGYVAACDSNTLGPDGTIPNKLLRAALALIVVDIQTRAAGKIIDPNGMRESAAKEATRLLENVAACRFAIDVPDVASSEVISVFEPSFSGREARFTDTTMDGA